MNLNLVSILLSFFVIVSITGHTQEIQLLESVVARYRVLDPDHSEDGDRILNLLLTEKIRAVTRVENVAIVTVAPQDAARAREVVARAILDENLRVNLVGKSPVAKESKPRKSLFGSDGKKLDIVAVEVEQTVEISGGFAGYFSKDGPIIYQGIVFDFEKGQGLIEKRYVLNDTLFMEWNELLKRFSLSKILEEKAGRQTAIAGESEFTLKVHLSDGSSRERTGLEDDPVSNVCRYIQKRAWSLAANSVPLIQDYESESFGNLDRFLEEGR